MSATIAVDGGQTEVRAGIYDDGTLRRVETLTGLQYPESGDDLDTITRLLDQLANIEMEGKPDTVVLALTGMPGAGRTRAQIAAGVLSRLDATRAVIASDVPSSFLGALGGTRGAVVSAGSGAIAFAADGAGTTATSGGGGALLGDDGSGYWIGHQALREAWRVHTGRDGSHELLLRARRRFGSLDTLPRRLRTSTNRVSQIASFVPEVGAAAAAGDPVAISLLSEAGAHLAHILRAAAARVFGDLTSREPPVPASWSGRLMSQELIADAFSAELAHSAPRLALTPPVGSALDGAHQLAFLHDLTIFGSQVYVTTALRGQITPTKGRP